jgi:hypothetical protein
MMPTTEEFAEKLRAYDDDTLMAASVLSRVVTRRGPNAKEADKAMSAELRRRRLGSTVDRFVELTKTEGERIAAETTVANLPDGSQVFRMPGGASATIRMVRE